MRLGAKGPEVEQLQQALVLAAAVAYARGDYSIRQADGTFYSAENFDMDGEFGPQTEALLAQVSTYLYENDIMEYDAACARPLSEGGHFGIYGNSSRAALETFLEDAFYGENRLTLEREGVPISYATIGEGMTLHYTNEDMARRRLEDFSPRYLFEPPQPHRNARTPELEPAPSMEQTPAEASVDETVQAPILRGRQPDASPFVAPSVPDAQRANPEETQRESNRFTMPDLSEEMAALGAAWNQARDAYEQAQQEAEADVQLTSYQPRESENRGDSLFRVPAIEIPQRLPENVQELLDEASAALQQAQEEANAATPETPPAPIEVTPREELPPPSAEAWLLPPERVDRQTFAAGAFETLQDSEALGMRANPYLIRDVQRYLNDYGYTNIELIDAHDQNAAVDENTLEAIAMWRRAEMIRALTDEYAQQGYSDLPPVRDPVEVTGGDYAQWVREATIAMYEQDSGERTGGHLPQSLFERYEFTGPRLDGSFARNDDAIISAEMLNAMGINMASVPVRPRAVEQVQLSGLSANVTEGAGLPLREIDYFLASHDGTNVTEMRGLAHVSLDRNEVASVQRLLQVPVSGEWDSPTVEAYRMFETETLGYEVATGVPHYHALYELREQIPVRDILAQNVAYIQARQASDNPVYVAKENDFDAPSEEAAQVFLATYMYQTGELPELTVFTDVLRGANRGGLHPQGRAVDVRTKPTLLFEDGTDLLISEYTMHRLERGEQITFGHPYFARGQERTFNPATDRVIQLNQEEIDVMMFTAGWVFGGRALDERFTPSWRPRNAEHIHLELSQAGSRSERPRMEELLDIAAEGVEEIESRNASESTRFYFPEQRYTIGINMSDRVDEMRVDIGLEQGAEANESRMIAERERLYYTGGMPLNVPESDYTPPELTPFDVEPPETPSMQRDFAMNDLGPSRGSQ